MAGSIKKILVPVYGSRQSLKALDRTINLANSKLTVPNVILHIGEGGPRTKEFDKQTVFQGKAVVHNAVKIAKKKDLKISTKILRG